jgi:hypothetical protein
MSSFYASSKQVIPPSKKKKLSYETTRERERFSFLLNSIPKTTKHVRNKNLGFSHQRRVVSQPLALLRANEMWDRTRSG